MSLQQSAEIPRQGIYRFIQRCEEQRVERTLEEINFGFRTFIENQLTRPSKDVAPHIRNVKKLAAVAMIDLLATDQQGHLGLLFVDEPNAPMHHIIVATVKDCPGESSVMISLALNVDQERLDFWRHTKPPTDILVSGIRTMAKAAEILAQELKSKPGHVLYRSEFPLLE